MNDLKCPHCGVKLGQFLYACQCPFCHEALKHNTRPLVSVKKRDPQKPKSWQVRLFLRIVRFVES